MIENELATKQYVSNIYWAKWQIKYFFETFVHGSTEVILMNFSSIYPLLRQAPKRYMQYD